LMCECDVGLLCLVWLVTDEL